MSQKILIPKEHLLKEISDKVKADFEAAAKTLNHTVNVISVNWVEGGLELEVDDSHLDDNKK